MNRSDALLKYALCFSMFFMIKWISKPNWSNRLFDKNGVLSSNAGNLVGLHLAGILWLGIVPVIFFKRSFDGILFGEVSPGLSWVLSFISLTIVITMIILNASRRVQLSNGNDHILSIKFLGQYFFVRILFLVAYELFFRGLLLFDCIKWFGAWQAVALTTILTVFIHLLSDKKEMWGCIPYGIIAACYCISIHAVWPAIILHLSFSIAYEASLVTRFLTQLKLLK